MQYFRSRQNVNAKPTSIVSDVFCMPMHLVQLSHNRLDSPLNDRVATMEHRINRNEADSRSLAARRHP